MEHQDVLRADVNPAQPIAEQTLSEHGEFVRRLAGALVRDEDQAQDVVQETWLAAMKNPPRSPEAWVSWLRTATFHIASKLRRGERRRQAREQAVAVPESAERTDEIVERLQLQQQVIDAVLQLDEPYRTVIVERYLEDRSPREIAARMNAPLNTIRARLRRGLERLRWQLDRRHGGDRSAWCAALLPLVSIRDTAIAAGATAGSALTWGSIGMTTKSIAPFAAVIALCSVSVSLLIWDGEDPEDGGRDGRSVPQIASALPGAPRGANATDEVVAAAHRERVFADGQDPDGDDQINGAHPDSGLPAPGQVLFKAVDGRSGKTQRQVAVRFLSAERFADAGTFEGTVDAWLTAGVYRASLVSPGFEPREIGPFSVSEGQITDLGFVLMDRGHGVIEGRAQAPWFPRGTRVQVVLRGEGRHPCVDEEPKESAPYPGPGDGEEFASPWERSEACESCGFTAENSTLSLDPGERFAFRHLAAGNYLLQASIPGEQPIGVARQVELKRGDWQFQDLLIRPTTEVTLRLQDEDGQLIDGKVQQGDVTYLSGVDFSFFSDEGEIASAHVPTSINSDVPLLTSSRFIYSQPDVQSYQPIVLAALNRSLQTRYRLIQSDFMVSINPEFMVVEDLPERADRQRNDEDSLLPGSEPITPDSTELTARRLKNGLFVVEAVPMGEFHIQATCGSLVSDMERVDLRSYTGRPIPLTMKTGHAAALSGLEYDANAVQGLVVGANGELHADALVSQRVFRSGLTRIGQEFVSLGVEGQEGVTLVLGGNVIEYEQVEDELEEEVEEDDG